MDHSKSQSPVQPVRIRVPILRMLAQRFPRHFLRLKLEKDPVLHVRKDVLLLQPMGLLTKAQMLRAHRILLF
eukprot:symbB.v1.2.004316.t1/scaffold188.1/size279614/5